jgi:hypothetical protein
LCSPRTHLAGAAAADVPAAAVAWGEAAAWGARALAAVVGPGGRRGMGGRGHRRHHRRHHGSFYPVYPWYPYWYSPYSYYYPNYGAYTQPEWYQPETCAPPISDDCTRLQPTARWATSCFLPRFRYLRNVYGDDYERLASALAREEAPWCSFPARSGAAAEYQRRVQLAVAVLLNAEGTPVRYPRPPLTPRPANADSIQQPWMRALLTGWT